MKLIPCNVSIVYVLSGSKTAVAQVYGLQLTTIAKGAFLIRASIIFTPILSTIAGDAVPRGLWAGALLGFAGMPCITALHPNPKS